MIALLSIAALLMTSPGVAQPGDVMPAEATSRDDSVATGAVIHFDKDRCTFVVKGVIAGSPAEKSGIRSGDSMLAIAGIDLGPPVPRTPEKCSYEYALKLLDQIDTVLRARGPGTVVVVRTERNGVKSDHEVKLKLVSDLKKSRAAERARTHD